MNKKRIVSMLLVVFMLLADINILATESNLDKRIEDNFNNEATGSKPSTWTVKGNITVEEVPNADNKSMKIYDNNGRRHYASKYFEPMSDVTVAEFKLMTPDTKKQNAGFHLNGDGIEAVTIKTKNGKIMYKKSKRGWINLQDYETNKWYDIKIVSNPNTNKCSVYIDGSLLLNDTDIPNPVSSFNEVKFETGTAYRGTMYVDDVKVYSSNEEVEEEAEEEVEEETEEELLNRYNPKLKGYWNIDTHYNEGDIVMLPRFNDGVFNYFVATRDVYRENPYMKIGWKWLYTIDHKTHEHHNYTDKKFVRYNSVFDKGSLVIYEGHVYVFNLRDEGWVGEFPLPSTDTTGTWLYYGIYNPSISEQIEWGNEYVQGINDGTIRP